MNISRGIKAIVFVGTMLLASGVFAYEGADITGGGSMSGVIKFDGKAPARTKVVIDKDKAVCGKDEKFTEDLIVGKNNGIKNVVVSIKGIQSGKKMDLNPKPVLTQDGCFFYPHVLLVPTGKKVAVLNKDGLLHNFHSYSIENPSVNKAQPKFKKKMKVKFNIPETIKINCDAHGWMNAWFIVTDHPYYAVTNDSGEFKIDNIPPGTYQVEIWQESIGKQIKEVVVKSNSDTKIDIALKK